MPDAGIVGVNESGKLDQVDCDVGEGGHHALAHMPDPQLDGLGLAIDVKVKLLVASGTCLSERARSVSA